MVRAGGWASNARVDLSRLLSTLKFEPEEGEKMPEITVDQATYDKLRFSATLMNRPTGDVVRLLVERLDSNTQAPPVATGAHPTPAQGPEPEGPSKWLPVFRQYKGRRFE